MTQDDQPTPEATVGGSEVFRVTCVVCFSGEDDGSLGSSFCEDLAPASDDQGAGFSTLPRFALDDGAWLDGEGFAFFYKHQPVEDVLVVGCPGSVPGNVCIGDLQYTRWSWIHWLTFRDTEALVLHVTSGCQSCPLGGPVLGSKSTLEAHIGKEGIVHWEECIAQSRAISHGPGVEHFIVVAADTRQLGIGNLIETIGFGEQEGRVGVGNGRGTVTSTSQNRLLRKSTSPA